MISALPKETVIETGTRHRASYLLEQAGYTLGLAKMDGDDLVDLMEDGMTADVEAAREAVAEAYKEKTVAAEEAKSSTRVQNETLHKAKTWRRAVVSRCVSAKRAGKDVPAQLVRIEKGQSVPETASQIDAMLKLLESTALKIHGKGVDKLVNEGRKLAAALASADADQELKRSKTFSDKMRDFYYQKGLLFIGLKRINDAGHELHRSDPTASAKYNLSILYRNSRKKKEEPQK